MTADQRHLLKNVILYILKDFSGGSDYIKLYKILYFAHKEQLATIGIPLVNDNFKAWRLGPVPSFAGSVIKHLETGDPLTDDMLPFKKAIKVRRNKLVSALEQPEYDCIPEYSRFLIDKHIAKCKYQTADALSQKSHDAAWIEAYYGNDNLHDGQSSLRPELIAAAGDAPDSIIYCVKAFSRKSPKFYNERDSVKVWKSLTNAAASLHNLSLLPQGWDGDDADKVKTDAALNCRMLIASRLARIDMIDDIYPTPMGNICIDWLNNGNKTSIEVGESRMAFYYTSADRKEIFDSPVMDFNDDACRLLYKYIHKCDA